MRIRNVQNEAVKQNSRPSCRRMNEVLYKILKKKSSWKKRLLIIQQSQGIHRNNVTRNPEESDG